MPTRHHRTTLKLVKGAGETGQPGARPRVSDRASARPLDRAHHQVVERLHERVARHEHARRGLRRGRGPKQEDDGDQ